MLNFTQGRPCVTQAIFLAGTLTYVAVANCLNRPSYSSAFLGSFYQLLMLFM